MDQLIAKLINYVKNFVKLCTIYDNKNRLAYIAMLGEVLQNTIWQEVKLLLDSKYKDKAIVEWILSGDAKSIFQKEENLVLNASFIEKIKYFFLRNTLRFKS